MPSSLAFWPKSTGFPRKSLKLKQQKIPPTLMRMSDRHLRQPRGKPQNPFCTTKRLPQTKARMAAVFGLSHVYLFMKRGQVVIIPKDKGLKQCFSTCGSQGLHSRYLAYQTFTIQLITVTKSVTKQQ